MATPPHTPPAWAFLFITFGNSLYRFPIVIQGLKLRFDCSGTYPESGVPSISLITGSINGLELPGVLEKEILRRAVNESVELEGSPSAFASVAAVDEFISSGEWVEWWRRGQPGGSRLISPSTSNQVDLGLDLSHDNNVERNEEQGPVPFDGNVEAIEEEAQNKYVRDATAIALARVTGGHAPPSLIPDDVGEVGGVCDPGMDPGMKAGMKAGVESGANESGIVSGSAGDACLSHVISPGRAGGIVSGSGDACLSHVISPGGAGGQWNFVVAAVGKPSVGKSTFFNALIRLKDFERKGADTAPHPFTTIEPNIATGWWAGPAEDTLDGQRGAAHGRDPKGRRYLPLLIKDVAGLVPGAYQVMMRKFTKL
jgi:hypothetical protein